MKKLITVFTIAVLFLGFKSNAQISTYPYIQTGDNISGWTVSQSVTLWYLGFAGKNPANVSNDLALVCNFYAYGSGTSGMVISPVFNFASLTKPMLNFYMAHKTHIAENDSLQVLLSTNGGSTYTVLLYSRAFNSTPSLSTLPPQVQQYVPSAPGQWRHETLDLSAFAGMNNIRIALRGSSGFGNDLWIDNFIISNADLNCTSTVSSPGTYSCNGFVSVNMNTVGRPVLQNVSGPENISRYRVNSDNRLIAMTLPECTQKNIQTNLNGNYLGSDNSSGGVLSFTEHLNQAPPSVSTPVIETNTTATNVGGTITNPNIIYHDYWFTVSYTGNDRFGYANYNISFDVTSFTNRSKLYIVKRADMTSPWVCLNTSEAGDNLVATGLTTFSDFAVAGDSLDQPLPVELSSFISTVNNRNVTLKWTTNSELNNNGFDIERSSDNLSWSKLGYAEGHGTTSNANHYSFTDRNLNSGRYNYRLRQIDFNGNFEYFNLSSEVVIGNPTKYELYQNYPNPFNPSTKINYDLPVDGKVRIVLYDISGKQVATLVNEVMTAGYHTVQFNASSAAGGFSSGIYFYSIETAGFTAVKKMMLIK